MSKISIDSDIIFSIELMDIGSLIPHEEIISYKKENKKSEYKKTNIISFNTIIACSEKNVIIDGHHRYNALKELGFIKIPVTRINYNSKKIITNEDDSILKSEIIMNAQNKKLYPPKTTNHLIFCNSSNIWLPIKVISSIYEIGN
tara:strand:+ start:940 stop:1374 length:435 start_codon:yes stop_codon:yes gene_type:complete